MFTSLYVCVRACTCGCMCVSAYVWTRCVLASLSATNILCVSSSRLVTQKHSICTCLVDKRHMHCYKLSLFAYTCQKKFSGSIIHDSQLLLVCLEEAGNWNAPSSLCSQCREFLTRLLQTLGLARVAAAPRHLVFV